MGRRKVNVEFIADDSTRHITFVKRVEGIAKKVHDLTKLTRCTAYVMIWSEKGDFVKWFSPTGSFNTDILLMADKMGVADSNPLSVHREMYTMNDYEQTFGKDKDGKQFIEWKRKEKTSYVRDPMLRHYNYKFNSRIAKLFIRARAEGSYNEDGTLLLPINPPEDDNKKKRVRKRRKYTGPPIIEDDDEIREAVGEERPPKKQPRHSTENGSKANPTSPSPGGERFTEIIQRQSEKNGMPPMPLFPTIPEEPAPDPTVDSVTVGTDGTLSLSHTEIKITHKNVRVSCQNLAEISRKYGFATGTPVFKFSHSLSNATVHPSTPNPPPIPPPPSQNHQPPAPMEVVEPHIFPSQYNNLIPGVSGDMVMSILHSPRPPTLHDKRIAERDKRNNETIRIPNSWEELLDNAGDMYGSFM